MTASWQPTASFDALRLRAVLNARIRCFFAERSVTEVETPVLSVAGNTDPNIASFPLHFSGRTDGAPRTRWLRTSPEHALKRLLAAGFVPDYAVVRRPDLTLPAVDGQGPLVALIAARLGRTRLIDNLELPG